MAFGGLVWPKASEALAAGLAAVEDAAEAVLLVDEPAHQGFEVFVRTDALREFWTAVTAIENAACRLVRPEFDSFGSRAASIRD